MFSRNCPFAAPLSASARAHSSADAWLYYRCTRRRVRRWSVPPTWPQLTHRAKRGLVLIALPSLRLRQVGAACKDRAIGICAIRLLACCCWPRARCKAFPARHALGPTPRGGRRTTAPASRRAHSLSICVRDGIGSAPQVWRRGCECVAPGPPAAAAAARCGSVREVRSPQHHRFAASEATPSHLPVSVLPPFWPGLPPGAAQNWCASHMLRQFQRSLCAARVVDCDTRGGGGRNAVRGASGSCPSSRRHWEPAAPTRGARGNPHRGVLGTTTARSTELVWLDCRTRGMAWRRGAEQRGLTAS